MKAKSFQDITFFGTTTIGEKGQVVIPAEIRKWRKIYSFSRSDRGSGFYSRWAIWKDGFRVR